ncbi:MAG: hypothetical protein ACUVS2_14750 [Candidatus Flexifilum sp.]
MRISLVFLIAGVLIGIGVMLVVGYTLLNPAVPLIAEAGFAPDTISPNADGVDDVTIFAYTLSRGAVIDLTFTHEDGREFVFRQQEQRIPGEHRVAFSGVVDGYRQEGDRVIGQIVRRLMPDGVYTWTLRAVEENGSSDVRSGTLTIAGGDSTLPDILEFTVGPAEFTPNQDGISDRAYINVVLAKDSDLQVFLVAPDGTRILIPERLEGTRPGQAGRHTFDYEGGVDRNADPPPDGTYEIVASAQDAVGQRIEQRATIAIVNGGKPFAQIVTQPTGVSVVFETLPWDERYYAERDNPGVPVAIPADPAALSLTTVALPVGDLLVFKLTVENNGSVPIRTTGPEPGTVYTWDQNASTLGWFEEPGAWRIGIDCTTAARDYPWRWAVGTRDDLVAVDDPVTGATYYYLPPGRRAVVWGAIRMTTVEVYNPQQCWAGLIHERVGISQFNNVVGARDIELIEIGPADQTQP